MRKHIKTIAAGVGVIIFAAFVIGNDPDVQRAFKHPAPTATTSQAHETAPAAVTAKVNGFCDGILQLDWFDPSMNVTPEQIAAYAAESHECTVVRYLGSLSVTNYQGETGTDYIFVLTLHGKETWWVFTITAAGKIADVQ